MTKNYDKEIADILAQFAIGGFKIDAANIARERIDKLIQQAIAEHEQKQWKKIEADGYEKSIGWKLNYDFLKTLAENAANASGEQVQMEVAEATLIAFRELQAPYQQGGENPFRPQTDSNPKAFKP